MSVLKLIKEYEGKKVLIAGASGMTGKNLYNLLDLFTDVVGTCHSRQDYHSDGMQMEPREKLIKIDFTDSIKTQEFFNANRFDYVFICCAKTYNASVCKNNPECLILPNIQMVSNILENCLKTGVKKVLYISSATVYQPSDKPLAESELDWNQNPHNLYMGIGWVKRYLEKLCEFYSTRGLTTLIVRPTNIYGKYDKTDLNKCHVVPAFIMRGLNREDPYVIRSLGNGIKNFIHVDDLVKDLVRIMVFHDNCSPINLCSDEEHSISGVVDILMKIFKEIIPDYKPFIRFEGLPDYVSYVGLKRDKLDSLFGKDKYIPLEKGLKEVVEWYSLLHQIQRPLITV